MKSLAVTVGEQKAPLYEGMKVVPDVQKVYLLASDFTKKTAEEVKQKISSIYQVEIVKTSEKDLDAAIETMISLHQTDRAPFIYNLSGGTKIMSLACHVVASFLGEDCFYIFKKEDGSMDVVEVPVLRYRLDKIVSKGDKRHAILKLLKQQARSVTELAQLLKLKKSTISAGHVSKLLDYNLVRVSDRSRNKQRITITKTGVVLFALIDVLEKKRSESKNEGR